jgi:hypothetical protein
MGLTLLGRARANGFTGVVLADCAYGDVTEFRQSLDTEGWRYCVGIEKTLKVIAADADLGEVPPYTGRGRPPSRPEKVQAGATSASVLEWAESRARAFRKVTWREGSRGKLSSRFAAWRVRPAHKLSAGKEPLVPCWLLVEWPEGEAAPTKFFFSNLPVGTSLRQLVRTAKGRWWVEHSYKELKDELGLDHFEGRSWRGWPGPSMKKILTGSAAKGAESAGMQVVPDLAQRLAKFRRVEMPFHSAGLTAREVKMVEKLVDASRYLEEIYWRQIDPEGLTLYESLVGSKNPKDEMLRRYLWINASRFDLLDDNKPFVGTTPMSPGRGFYPQNLTREQIEQYVKAHPEKKDEIYSSFTVVRWHGDQLEGLPYHIAYRSFLEPAAKDLREAAGLSDDPAFANFLRLRADALLSDDYYKSNLALLDLKNPKFDVAFAPDETYDDGLLGVKATYGAAVMIRNAEESHKLEMFQKYVADIQDALSVAGKQC